MYLMAQIGLGLYKRDNAAFHNASVHNFPSIAILNNLSMCDGFKYGK